MRTRIILLAIVLLTACARQPGRSDVRCELTFPSSARSEPVTGRAYVVMTLSQDSRARLQRSFGHQPVSGDAGEPFFGADLKQVSPGSVIMLDDSSAGYPVRRISDLPDGAYFAQAVLNIYTQFQRSDGHTIWAHMDQWEGQHFN